jgi:uncharacterized protein with HEPN domain
MPEADRVRMQHMLDAAREARAFLSGRDRAGLESDRLLALGLAKCIEILGEAASRVSPECQARNSGIPWRDIVGMRNRLIHVYFDVDLDQVWNTVTQDLPPLVAKLEAALAGEAQ